MDPTLVLLLLDGVSVLLVWESLGKFEAAVLLTGVALVLLLSGANVRFVNVALARLEWSDAKHDLEERLRIDRGTDIFQRGYFHRLVRCRQQVQIG